MIKAGKKKAPKPTRANADSSAHRAPERGLAVVMREKLVESPQRDERREFYRIVGSRVIAEKYYLGRKENAPVFFSLEEEQDRGSFTSTRLTAD